MTTAVRPLTEAQWSRQVTDLLSLYGWTYIHHFLSVRSAAGWPDLFAVNPARGQALAIELKSERGQLTTAQARWLADLAACGVAAYCWRPSDWEWVVRVVSGREDGG